MALGLRFVIGVAVTVVTGYFLSPAGITPARAVDGMMLVGMVMIVTSLHEFHHSGRWKANACRR